MPEQTSLARLLSSAVHDLRNVLALVRESSGLTGDLVRIQENIAKKDRMLDAETIELKEEIYGNLVARYEDYLAQGMSAEEAYARTCEAVTSVDDVMGEKDEAAAPTTATTARLPSV